MTISNFNHKYGAGLLIPTYLLLGITLAPTKLLHAMSGFETVEFNECHRSCHKLNDGRQVCTSQCSWRGSPERTQKKVDAMSSGIVHRGGPGPTAPPKPTQGRK
jgi:hypothetical protein